MSKQRLQKPRKTSAKPAARTTKTNQPVQKTFHFEFMNPAQKFAWNCLNEYDVLFLLGPAGTGKTLISCAYAISEILSGKKEQIVLTRPIVEAGEHLGFLPGDMNEKVSPYMTPMTDAMQKCLGRDGPQKDLVQSSIKIAPLAYMRGNTFDNSICIFDEAQNATKSQLKLFLTRFGKNSKVIVTGDPYQSDLRHHEQGFMHVVESLRNLNGIGIIEFCQGSIVRHPLIGSILDRLEKRN